jgi:hypothetical protein
MRNIVSSGTSVLFFQNITIRPKTFFDRASRDILQKGINAAVTVHGFGTT